MKESRNKKTMVKFQAICRGWVQRRRAVRAKEFAIRAREAVPFLSAFKVCSSWRVRAAYQRFSLRVVGLESVLSIACV